MPGEGNLCRELDVGPDMSSKLLGMRREENLTQEKWRDVTSGKPSCF